MRSLIWLGVALLLLSLLAWLVFDVEVFTIWVLIVVAVALVVWRVLRRAVRKAGP